MADQEGIDEIQTRLNNVRSVEPILGAMRTISLGSWQAALNRQRRVHQFSQRLTGLLPAMAASLSPKGSRRGASLRRRDVPSTPATIVVLVIGSERGLCGAFNSTLIRYVEGELDRYRSEGARVELTTLGSRAERGLQRNGHTVAWSRPLPMTILPFPEEGKPRDFSGAVGDFEFTVLADPAEVKVGDPITLKMNVAGRGNLKSVDMPALDVGDDFKVYDPEVTQDETGKTSKQAIIPKDDDVSEIPKMSFSFFNPALEKYETITKGPIPITVKPLAKGEGLKVFEPRPEGPRDVTRKKEILGRDIIYIKDNPGNLAPKGEFLYKNKLFIIFQFIPALLVVSVLIVQRKRERLQKDIRYARKLRAPGKAKKNLHMTHRLLNPKEPDKFYDAVFKTLQEYIGDTFHLPTAGITSNVVGELKVRNIDEGILAKVGECFENCDTARYAHTDITREQMLATYKLLEEVIDRLERVRI